MALILLTQSCQTKEKHENSKTSYKNKLIKVTVQKVNTDELNYSLSYNGTITPTITTPLSFLLSGTITNIFVEEGDFVKKGKILAKLDESAYRSAFESTAATEKQAQDAYNRLKTVYDKGSLPEIKWQEITAKLQQAKSLNKIAYQNLSNTILKAPSNGYIGKRNVEIGELAITGIPILNLVSINDVYVKIAVPENEINRFNKGISADIIIPAIGSEHFKGKVDKIGVIANTVSKTYDVKIKVANKKGVIKPGMACDVTIIMGSKEDMITIPYQSITKDEDGENYVFTVDPNSKVASKQVVQLGSFVNNKIEIISGISRGDLIIIDGKQKITDQQKVTF
ncbi:efflux RND transporter periplasmic adaptor subunit [Lutibacter profundi]|nr:efflux RND transporter periplasmic adaptor subunit [Lutibacter profundi]